MILKKKMKIFTKTELKNEKWKDIFGYDGMYQVSDLGRVRSKKYGRWKVLKNGTTGNGYLTVCLFKDNKVNGLLVHRLVAQAFIENDNIFNDQVNHKDENKKNNRATNLEWCDRQYNLTYNDLNLRKKPFIHKKYKQIKIKDLYNPNLSYKENLEIFKSNGIDCSTVTLWKLRNDLGLTRKYTKRQYSDSDAV